VDPRVLTPELIHHTNTFSFENGLSAGVQNEQSPPKEQEFKMQTCKAFKTDGQRCTHAPLLFNAFPEAPVPGHLRLCRTHQRIYRDRYIANASTHHTAGCCFDKVGAQGLWCTHPAVGETFRCLEHTAQHTQIAARRAAVAQAHARRNAAFDFFDDREPRPNWRQVTRELTAPDAPQIIRNPDVNPLDILRNYYQLHRAQDEPQWWNGGANFVIAYRQWLIMGQPGPEPQAAQFIRAPPPLPVAPPAPAPGPGVPELGRLSRDTQNVHRAVVSEQTNRNVELLLATPDVPEHCRAHELLAAVWLNLRIASWSHVRQTIDDMVAWREKPTCKVTNDWLYRKLLHGLFMRIYRMPEGETRKELWKRFYQECSESIGMCCEGHISRLANVLVGFEEDFKPPIPFGEIVQARMSSIAEMDAPLEEKVRLAMAFFDDHKVPLEARTAWLDAF
jgi:hypothetical protein